MGAQASHAPPKLMDEKAKTSAAVADAIPSLPTVLADMIADYVRSPNKWIEKGARIRVNTWDERTTREVCNPCAPVAYLFATVWFCLILQSEVREDLEEDCPCCCKRPKTIRHYELQLAFADEQRWWPLAYDSDLFRENPELFEAARNPDGVRVGPLALEVSDTTPADGSTHPVIDLRIQADTHFRGL